MIRIDKGQAPNSLVTKGKELSDILKSDFDKNPKDYLSGEETFEFTGDYRSKAVQKRLKKRQHNKCCFSEAKFNGDYAQVEHFRPKGRVDNYPSDGTSRYPGYYWLAYDWSNLFLSKGKPNISYKRNFFPLEKGSDENISHKDGFSEKPMLIDPSKDNPRDHIQFHADEPFALTERGVFSIDIYGLRNSDFEEGRRTKFNFLKRTKEVVELLESDSPSTSEKDTMIATLRMDLQEAMKPTAEYSSMATDFLSDMFLEQ